MRTKRLSLSVMVCLLLCAGHLQGQTGGRFGIGIMLGDPSGLSWKYHLSARTALAGVAGFSPFDRFRLHVDHLWVARPFDEPALTLWYGVGGVLGFGHARVFVRNGKNSYVTRSVSTGFGVRMAGALTYAIPRSPVEAGVELAPVLIIGPDPGAGLDAGLFVRFYP